MKKYFFLAAAAAMMLSACSNDLDNGQNDGPIPLTIGYSLSELSSPVGSTRANGNDIQSTSILNDNTNSHVNAVGVFVLKEGQKTATTGEQYERFNVTSTSLSTDNPATGYTGIGITGVNALYYPENKTQKIDIYTYAPWKNVAVTDITSPIAINTATDQTSIDNYMASDVLWGCAGTGTYVEKSGYDGTTYTPEGPYHKLGYSASVYEISANQYMIIKKNETAGTPPTPTNTTNGKYDAYYFEYDNPANIANAATVVVPMLHRGSKIVVNLLPGGMAKDKLKNAVVKFNVDYIAGSLNVSTGEYSVTSGTPAPTATTPITLTDHLGIKAQGAATEEGVATVTTANDAYTCSAVIVPQTLSITNNGGNGNIITIDLKSDLTSSATTTAQYAYKTGSTTNPSFESGKVYTYNITVQATGLVVTTTVSNWVDGTSSLPGGNGNGTAVLQ